MLPIINGSPAECEYLYAAMKEAEKIKRIVSIKMERPLSLLSLATLHQSCYVATKT